MNIKVYRKKLRLGLLYGFMAGSAFAVFAWGIDAWMLAQAHDTYYWVKFVPGLLFCLVAGGLAGVLTILLRRHLFAVLLWALVASLFSWLVVWLPFTGVQSVISMVNPNLAEMFHFSSVQDAGQFRLISIFFVGLAGMICGLLEINLIDQASLSPYLSGSVVPLAICLILFSLAGSATDHMINTNLREPMQVIDSLLQFAKDNYGLEVPNTTARKMHLSATNQLGELVQKPHRLALVGFDENLLIVDILVDFNGTRAKCTSIYSQPSDCIILPPNP